MALNSAVFTPYRLLATSCARETEVTDSVAVDAKRILLRYGAPIAVLDKVSEKDRIKMARQISKTTLPEREPRLREMLVEGGYVEKSEIKKKKRK